MDSPDEFQQQVVRICSENPPATVFHALWRLAEKHSRETVLGAILRMPVQVQDWLRESLGFYDDEDDGRQDFFAVSLVDGEVVESAHFPKKWVEEVRKALMPPS